ncbi:MAG: DUF502 domain-containing protein [Armatimonadetes bacterium]|nr:DUF502 domain-containing protein [Armatimonadota bacterium]
MRHRLRAYFITGLLVVLPAVVTISVLLWLFDFLDSVLGRFFALLLGRTVPGLGLVSSVLLVLLAGLLATNMLGSRFVQAFDRLVLRIPLVRSIYSATKQISDAIFLQRRGAFQRVVLLEWPRLGIYTVGFVTGETRGDLQETVREPLLNVFVITTPNPTTGFLMLVPRSQVIDLGISVEDGLKLAMSAGIVVPSRLSTDAPTRLAAEASAGPPPP